MVVGVFYPGNNIEQYGALLAFSLGVEAAGDAVDFRQLSTYDPSANEYDVCVVFGVHKEAVPASRYRGRVISTEIKIGKDIIILEKGFIHRETYFSAGLNGFNGLAIQDDYGVSSDRFNALRMPVISWGGNPAGPILLIGQVPWDASVQHTDHMEWVRQTARVIREYTSRPIRFRAHPLAHGMPTEIPMTMASHGTLQQDLEEAFAVVTFNSNVGVDAVLAGVPTFCVDPLSMVYPQAAHGLELINDPPIWDREAWANRLAYKQWTRQEMAAGIPWMRLKQLILKRNEDAPA